MVLRQLHSDLVQVLLTLRWLLIVSSCCMVHNDDVM